VDRDPLPKGRSERVKSERIWGLRKEDDPECVDGAESLRNGQNIALQGPLMQESCGMVPDQSVDEKIRDVAEPR